MLPPKTRDLAQRLLAYEGSAGHTSEPAEFAAFRVCETLRRPVCALVGVAGFRPLPHKGNTPITSGSFGVVACHCWRSARREDC
jgi:hypothetical protein